MKTVFLGFFSRWFALRVVWRFAWIELVVSIMAIVELIVYSNWRIAQWKNLDWILGWVIASYRIA